MTCKAAFVLAMGTACLLTASAQAQPETGADPHAAHNMAGMHHASASPMVVSTGTRLRASSPDAGAMLAGSPGEISVSLPHAMEIISVVLTNAVGQRVPLAATLPSAPVENFTSPAPHLVPGNYTVSWSARGGHHVMAGSFGFMVH